MGGMSQRAWTPTKRRGPIAAEYSSPGPACVTLPPLIGKTVPDSKRERAPAFSFGSRHSNKNESPGPGPGQYNVSGLCAKGKDRALALSLHGRTKPGKSELTPAPGDYDPQKAEKIIQDSSPKYSFGIKPHAEKQSTTPGARAQRYCAETGCGPRRRAPCTISGRTGMSALINFKSSSAAPGSYSPEKLELDGAPRYTFGRKTVRDRIDHTPAPGTYSPERTNQHKMPRYSFGTSWARLDHKSEDTPAPGTYSPERVNLRKGPEYSLYGRAPEARRANDNPAPGTYSPEKANSLNRGPEYSFYGKAPDMRLNDNPAPGTYSPEKTNLHRGPEFSLYGKAPEVRPNDNPAPGAYSPEKTNLHRGPEFSLYGKATEVRPNDNPAPGAYSPEKTNLHRGPEFSMSGKGSEVRPNDNPAPGAYSPEKTNLHRGPEFSMPGKAPEVKPNDNPAPGAYSPEKTNLHRGPEFSLYGKTSGDKPNENPGPGAYSPEKANCRHEGPAYSLYGKAPDTRINDNPAPGAYSPERTNITTMSQGPRYTFGTRTAFHKPNETPAAPGVYSPERSNDFLNKGPAFSLGAKATEGKLSPSPGPGVYSPEKALAIWQNAMRFTFGSRLSSERRGNDDLPAPNVYTIPSVLCGTKEGNKKTAPAYSISGRQKVLTDDRTLVPGPGTYEAIRTDILRAKSASYSMSARFSLPNDHAKIPGPGAHCPEKVLLDIPPAHTFGIRHSPYICNLRDTVY
ncbi:sperm-tail PG-rich repeat-containing protein 2-like isoform X3 [Venturia canescens]|uniref:sperm-tail PG-rich repeat-containing protein 2-like isoform X3 n=1 Tax=Venturia canescens TaxID=32260 RepID=UPI001C9BE0B4|nr:sperm-tail PG-rich repeat-containing protein 2-like isoform X3 [Venturia canescens]